jgi:hypothetical protein
MATPVSFKAHAGGVALTFAAVGQRTVQANVKSETTPETEDCSWTYGSE